MPLAAGAARGPPMNRALCTLLGSALAASALSGCFFGLLKVQRDPSIPPAPVSDATVKVLRTAPYSARPIGPAPSTKATPPETSTAGGRGVQASAATRSLPNIVRYSLDAYRPDPSFDASLRAHAEQLRADPNLQLFIMGHGDARGSIHYKRALAAKRAEMIARALIHHGVPARQLTQVIGEDNDRESPGVGRVELIYR
jgi:outer membrane protein OmpA-like peptidoglycan-associated protein